jgi:hypothetical protein
MQLLIGNLEATRKKAIQSAFIHNDVLGLTDLIIKDIWSRYAINWCFYLH